MESYFKRLVGVLENHIKEEIERLLELSITDKNLSGTLAYDGFFFVLLYNWKFIKKKHRLVLLMQLTKLLRNIKFAEYTNLQSFKHISNFLDFVLVADYSVLSQIEKLGKSENNIAQIWRNTQKLMDKQIETPTLEVPCNSIFSDLLSGFGRSKDFFRLISILSWLIQLGFHEKIVLAHFKSALSFLTPSTIEELSTRDLINIMYYVKNHIHHYMDDIENMLNVLDHRSSELIPLTVMDCNQLLQVIAHYVNRAKSPPTCSSLLLSIFVNIDCLSSGVKFIKRSKDQESQYPGTIHEKNGKLMQKKCENCIECKENIMDSFADFESLKEICIKSHGSCDFLYEFLDKHKLYCRNQDIDTRTFKWVIICSRMENIHPYTGEFRKYSAALIDKISQLA